MAPREPPTPWELQIALSEIDDRVWDLKRAMDDLLKELRPVLADFAYEQRRREEVAKAAQRASLAEQRSWLVLKVLVGVIAATPVAVAGYVSLAHLLFG